MSRKDLPSGLTGPLVVPKYQTSSFLLDAPFYFYKHCSKFLHSKPSNLTHLFQSQLMAFLSSFYGNIKVSSTSSLSPSIPKNLSTALRILSSFTEMTLQMWPKFHFLLIFQSSDFLSTSLIYLFLLTVSFNL